ncbi:MAG: protein-glutamate O-methyltransferase CheR [Microscillaceae bacterium]|nr:protein-glutamate O-methyltransferase CheR [Microscillaceae bacterium]
MLTLEALAELNEAIYQRYGLDLRHYEPQSLRRRVERIIRKKGLDSAYGLWQKMLYQPDFCQYYLNEITIGFTALFRNPGLWRFIGQQILPEMDRHVPFSVWHTGCSTGEEVYSMLITLYEHLWTGQHQIWATDVNSEALRQAQEGVYGQDLYRKYAQNYEAFSITDRDLQFYLRPHARGFAFASFLKQNLHFALHNLAQDQQSRVFDMIMCRNILIYFDEGLKIRILDKLAQQIRPGGFLVLGFYDTWPAQCLVDFELVEAGLKVFQKK